MPVLAQVCETCFTGCGFIWPIASDGDNQHSYVERCDACDRFKDDRDATRWLYDQLRKTWGDSVILGTGMYRVNDRLCPYIDVLDGNSLVFSLDLVQTAARR